MKIKLSKTHIRQAYRVRREMEKLTQDKTSKNPYFYIQDDLQGACFIASLRYVNYLWDRGVRARLAVAKSHAFVLVGKMVLDITATQFGSDKKVLIERHDRLRIGQNWDEYSPLVSYSKLDKRLFKEIEGWGEEDFYQYLLTNKRIQARIPKK